MEDTPEIEKASKRSSYMQNFDDAGEGPSNEKDMDDQRLSAFLRSDHPSRNHSPQNSQGSNQSHERPRPSFAVTPGDSSSPGQLSSNDNSQPRREDLRASAEKILYTYLLPGSEREIIIPQSILNEVQIAIEGNEQRSDPELFDQAKDYVFQAMERDAYPGFLQNKGLGNLVPQSMMIRLIVGLISFFAAVWAAFVLIFLDKSRATRCWVRLRAEPEAARQQLTDDSLSFLSLSPFTSSSRTSTCSTRSLRWPGIASTRCSTSTRSGRSLCRRRSRDERSRCWCSLSWF